MALYLIIKKNCAGSEGRFGYVSILYHSICVNDDCEC